MKYLSHTMLRTIHSLLDVKIRFWISIMASLLRRTKMLQPKKMTFTPRYELTEKKQEKKL